ncbi:MAG: PhzF family phenazine biosynthesis protein [Thermoplasmata archaeon]|nr:PhzF family phenazine biosynthesis protein [Thermoplasmata archaeon]
MNRRHPLYIVDAFTSTPFHGNPAAVCLLRKEYDDPVLQAVAAEMNLSETAFLRTEGDDLFMAERFSLRWFTPMAEVPLCGHATLASAKVLFDELGIAAPTVTFDTLSGPLQARQGGGAIEIDFPRNDPTGCAEPPGLREALGGAAPLETLEVRSQNLMLVRYDREQAILDLKPEFERIRRDLPPIVVATAPSTSGYDFVSRCFAPRLGIPEDPVTGMAHTVLGPYWARATGKRSFRAFQASSRGGEMTVELTDRDQVRLRGDARLVLRGYLDLPT